MASPFVTGMEPGSGRPAAGVSCMLVSCSLSSMPVGTASALPWRIQWPFLLVTSSFLIVRPPPIGDDGKPSPMIAEVPTGLTPEIRFAAAK